MFPQSAFKIIKIGIIYISFLLVQNNICRKGTFIVNVNINGRESIDFFENRWVYNLAKLSQLPSLRR